MRADRAPAPLGRRAAEEPEVSGYNATTPSIKIGNTTISLGIPPIKPPADGATTAAQPGGTPSGPRTTGGGISIRF